MCPRVLFGSLARCVGLAGASVDVVMVEGVWRLLIACTMYVCDGDCMSYCGSVECGFSIFSARHPSAAVVVTMYLADLSD